jgi:hypothetical protein
MLVCTHCDRDVRREPGTTVAVHEGGERSPTGVYCDYGCLAAHITDGELADGHTPAVAPE